MRCVPFASPIAWTKTRAQTQQPSKAWRRFGSDCLTHRESLR